MVRKKRNKLLAFGLVVIALWGCNLPKYAEVTAENDLPVTYGNSMDSANVAAINWKTYFSDELLIALIDTALKNNQELLILMQEIEINQYEIQTRKGDYLPFLNLKAGSGLEKDGRYTRHGAVDENIEIKPGTEFPEPLPDFMFGAYATWEIDVWHKLRNAKKSAISSYLASVEGKNFMITNLIAEMAEAYYELMAQDNLLQIIEQNIAIQSNALVVVKQQKDAGRVTELAVNRFEAQLYNTTSLKYETQQKVIEAENHIRFLTGGFAPPLLRDSDTFLNLAIDTIQVGIPSQLLINRPDIRQAEFELNAAQLNVKVARANFYPSLSISAGVGFEAFNPAFLVNPESILYNLAGDLVAPLINKNAIKAAYSTANAQQIQALYNYQQTILNAYVDVLNQLSRLDNFSKSYDAKLKEVNLLVESITISNNLFISARADYNEVLLTQEEALESKMELIEIKMKLLQAKTNIYRALGGGWN